jgi:hypothetical protein
MARHKKGTALRIVQKFFPKVTSVSDATSNVTIEVTERDERGSQKRDHNHCAMAVACKRAMHLDGVVIAICTAYLVKGTKATRYHVPMSVQREVVAFDRGAHFASGEYTLLKPDKNHLIGKAGGNGAKRNTAKMAAPKHWTEGIRTVLGSPKARRA